MLALNIYVCRQYACHLNWKLEFNQTVAEAALTEVTDTKMY